MYYVLNRMEFPTLWIFLYSKKVVGKFLKCQPNFFKNFHADFINFLSKYGDLYVFNLIIFRICQRNGILKMFGKCFWGFFRIEYFEFHWQCFCLLTFSKQKIISFLYIF